MSSPSHTLPLQVGSLGDGSTPEDLFRPFVSVPNMRVIVCGGDGTAGWVISALGAVKPMIAIIPLGTGARERA